MNQKPQFDITQSTEIVCNECNHNVFIPSVFLRKISKFLTDDGIDRVIPLNTMSCAKCGHVNKEFNPLPLNNKQDEEREKRTIITKEK